MAAKTIASRLNDKNRVDKEIMDWLDESVGHHWRRCFGMMIKAVRIWKNTIILKTYRYSGII